MIGRLSSKRPADRSGFWLLLALVLALLGAGGLVEGVRQHAHPLAAPVSPARSMTPSRSGSPPPVPPMVVPPARSSPVLLQIPAISLSVPVSQLGLNADGSVEVPADTAQPGWYRLGPSPGQVGSAVILGHVDSYQGPAVFFRLRTLEPGDRIEVHLADGVTTQFVVTAVAMYQKTQFPNDQVYASRGYSALQLVTCGGAFDRQTGHYLSNVVVYSSLVSSTPAASSVTDGAEQNPAASPARAAAPSSRYPVRSAAGWTSTKTEIRPRKLWEREAGSSNLPSPASRDQVGGAVSGRSG